MKAVKQMANPWATLGNDSLQVENMLDKVKDLVNLNSIVGIDIDWNFEDTDYGEGMQVGKFIGEAKAFLGDSAEQIDEQLNKMDFDYVIDPWNKDWADIWGTIWLNNGSWIDIFIDSTYDKQIGMIQISSRYKLHEAPTKHRHRHPGIN